MWSALWLLQWGLSAPPVPFVVTSDPEPLSLRAADRVALHLDRLGAPVWSDRAWVHTSPGLPQLNVEAEAPEGTDSPSAPLRLKARFQGQSHKASGPRRRFDALCARLALAVRAAAQERFPPETEAMLAETLPWQAHEVLAKARAREVEQKPVVAALLYDRAAQLGDLLSLEAFDGRARVRPSPQADRTRDAELAKSAAFQAAVARRQGDRALARRSWVSYLKYTPSRGRWAAIPHPPVGPLFWVRDRGWFDAECGRVSLTPEGSVGCGPRQGELRAAGPRFLLETEGRRLSRAHIQEDGRLRSGWQRTLSITPEQVRVAGGLVGVHGSQKLLWLDPGLGQMTDVVAPERPFTLLSLGSRGALYVDPQQMGLLRPGQTVAAWTQPSPPQVQGALLTDERVALQTPEGPRILRMHNGQPLPFQGRGEWLHAAGRFGVLTEGNQIDLVDLLSGQVLASFQGPSRAEHALSRPEGVAVAFASGDLQWLSPDGKVRLRARVPGTIRWLRAGGDDLFVGTNAGVLRYRDSGSDELGTTAALLELARTAVDAQDNEKALVLAQWAARTGLNHIAEAERLRAELLPQGAARDYAEDRARSADDPATPLLPFRLAGAPAGLGSESTERSGLPAKTSSTASSRSGRRPEPEPK